MTRDFNRGDYVMNHQDGYIYFIYDIFKSYTGSTTYILSNVDAPDKPVLFVAKEDITLY